MQRKTLQVMTKLGKACDLLKAVEAMPETQKCADIIRRARLEVEEAVNEMRSKKAVSLRKVTEILGVISKVFTLLKLLGLGDILNFCTQLRIIYAIA